jgi:Tol biopolymer transport system component
MRLNTITRTLLLLGVTAIASACSDESNPVAPVISKTPALAKGGPNALPTNGRIYFTSAFAGNYDVYSMKSDGTDRRRLTYTSEYEAFMNVSRDGKKLVVGTYRDDGAELVTMNVDGSNRRVVVSAEGSTRFFYPAFSPDGRTIAYTTRSGNGATGYSIWTVSVSGGKATQLTPTTESSTFPSWSPDGRQIVFSRGPISSLGEDLYIMNADGTNAQLLVECTDTCLTPVWSPDGGSVYYIAALNGVLSLQSCVLDAVIQCGWGIAHTDLPTALNLSPDGTQLVTAAYDATAQQQRIFTMNVNGSSLTMITGNLFSIGAVAWGR